MKIENVTLSDIDTVFDLYRIAADYQRSKQTVVVWPEFDRDMVTTEIREQRQWKLLIDGRVACIWATTFSDEQIWEERNRDAAVYIHRIATHPDFRGQHFVQRIVAWAKEYARLHQKAYIRLDTLDRNTGLIRHYTQSGFTFLGMFDMQNTEGLPDHYHGKPVCLFQIAL